MASIQDRDQGCCGLYNYLFI